jgi:tetratricopeptide (TPR) repeat protein
VSSIRAKSALIAAFFVLLTYAGELENGLLEYKAANYRIAIPLLETAARTTIKDPVISAALLSALVYEGRV